MSRVHSFPPLSSPKAKVLILGSMPGVASLRAQQYYAHPRNAFWRLMSAVFGVPEHADYAQRCVALQAAGVAVWDVLQACSRDGSLDSAIEVSSMVVNDLVALWQACPQLACIAFNGGTAAQVFERHAAAGLAAAEPRRWAHMRLLRLPSTSPAHAALSFDQKLLAWQALRLYAP